MVDRLADQSGSDRWLKARCLDYMPLDEQLAVVRLTAELRGGSIAPVCPALVVGGPESVLRTGPLGGLAHRVPRRFRGADELLWRVTFALPLELVEHPDAIFALVARGYAPTRLPDPTLATLAALSQPWPVGARGAILLDSAAWRRAAALGTAIAVAGTSGVSPAIAGAVHGDSKLSGHIHSAPARTIVHAPSTHAPAAATHAAGPPSAQHSLRLVGGVTSSTHRHPILRTHKTGSAAGSATPAAAQVPAAAPSSLHAPARSAGASGTDPGSEHAAPAPAAALIEVSAARRHRDQAQVGFLRGSGGVSKLSPTPPGSIEPGAKKKLANAVGHDRQGHGHKSTRAGHRHATVPVRGAHPLGSGGGAVAKPKPPAPEPVSSPPAATSTSGSSPGSNPFNTGLGANTPGLSLFTKLAGVYSASNQPPPFLIPIYKKAGTQFHIPWAILAAINSIESDYGRNLNTSSAGAIGWMQFMPATWAQYGIAIDHSGPPNPYNPADAIFSAAKYLAANGGAKNLRQAIYAYNHAQWYVDEVLLRAQLIRDHVSGGLVNPFPLGWIPNRLDMGYDGTFSTAIVAPFSGTITYAARSFSNWGGYLELKADHPIPGLPSDTLYFAEGLAPTVKAGQHVSAGELIAVPAPSPYGDAYNTTAGGHGQIEWGLASPGTVGTPTNPLAESGISRPANVVIGFAIWVVKNLDLAAPSQVSNAGYP